MRETAHASRPRFVSSHGKELVISPSEGPSADAPPLEAHARSRPSEGAREQDDRGDAKCHRQLDGPRRDSRCERDLMYELRHVLEKEARRGETEDKGRGVAIDVPSSPGH
eukprot:CAMPEP_0183344960 /NCGR_PEP_ID=MMETSP0164_2-20130417/10519_1 /TAXON_ID=221442 /ORGANISM="Coccolithus pelagicus ssp braarudi, Strain PLY182g" /LENGTH=109 /DNA_ID=CAMNT_0025516045 /DNA_START=147 /DNA_END=476 /DNA_ORIENTATION=-